MPRIPRKFVFDPTEVGVYHCINRCVRRAFLCGTDTVSGKCFDHRKDWIQQRLEFLARHFAVDVLGFSIMSNHIHVVVRNRPDVVAAWSDDDVARRWWNVFPQRRDRAGNPAEPTDSELTMTTANSERLAQVRSRLSNLSWFMRCLVEPIARQANREDKCSGRFFELLDWTGRQMRADKRGAIPPALAPVFERLKMSGESWLHLVHDFRRKFRRAAGTPASLLKEAQKRGCHKMQGIIHSRAIFDPSPPRSTA